MNSCGCQNEEKRLTRRGAETAAWMMPTLALILVPKCPACLAAYIAMATGIGISVSTAGLLRMFWVVLCVSALAILMTRSARRFVARGSSGAS